MNYFKLKNNLYHPSNRWFLGSLNLKNEFDFWKLVMVGEDTSYFSENELEISIRSVGTALDFTFADFGVPIINEKVAMLLNPNDVKLFPVSIQNINAGNYYIMVIKHAVECVDETKSEFVKWEEGNSIRPDKAGSYESIYKLVLDATYIGNREIFRVAKYDTMIIVNENLKQKFEKARITGVEFKSL